jgi:hypothetical protein
LDLHWVPCAASYSFVCNRSIQLRSIATRRKKRLSCRHTFFCEDRRANHKCCNLCGAGSSFAAGIRRSLVVFQFVLRLVLIICITVIYSQLDYIRTKDLGFEKKQKLIFSFYTLSSIAQMPAFIDDLRRVPGVKEVSNGCHYLSGPSFYSIVFFCKDKKMLIQKMQIFF